MHKNICAAFAILATTSTLLAHEEHIVNHSALPPASMVPVTTGQAALSFTTVPGWAKLPAGLQQFGPLHGSIVQDKAGRYFISSDADAGIFLFDQSGQCLRTFGKEFAGIHGMTIREEAGTEVIYAAQLSRQRIIKFDLEGKLLLEIGAPDGKWSPTAVAVSADGSIFAADGYGSSRIFKLDASGKLLKTFSGRGLKGDKTQTCHGLAIDTRDGGEKLLVCDRENRRLSHFDLDGRFLTVIAEGLRRPCAVSIRGDQVAIAELEGRVVIIDKNNQITSILGDNPRKKQWATNQVKLSQLPEGIFGSPHGLLYDRDGNLVVQDWNLTGRITFLRHSPCGLRYDPPPVSPLHGKPNLNAELDRLILEAEGRNDHAACELLTLLAAEPEFDEGTLPQVDPFDGELLHATLRLSSTSEWDSPRHHWDLFTLKNGFFHTAAELQPSATASLKQPAEISGLVLINRTTMSERAVPLNVEISTDGKDWTKVFTTTESAAFWRISLPAGTKARHIRISSTHAKPNFLHLRAIRIYGRQL